MGVLSHQTVEQEFMDFSFFSAYRISFRDSPHVGDFLDSCRIERGSPGVMVRTIPDPLPPPPPSGLPEMDAAHARLWARLRELRQALERDPLTDATAYSVTLLTELREEYAGEEALMANHGYRGMAMHCASHALLDREFSALARAVRDMGHEPPVGGRLVSHIS
jgi:hypothetical protein